MEIKLVDEKDVCKGKGKLIEHHTKYKEIHGEDKTVPMPFGEHIRLHRRLRKEGKCNIPSNELGKISNKAYHRSEKTKNGYMSKSKTFRINRKEMNIRIKERVLGIKR